MKAAENAELGVEVSVEGGAVPVVDAADELAVSDVDRGEDTQLTAEQLGVRVMWTSALGSPARIRVA